MIQYSKHSGCSLGDAIVIAGAQSRREGVEAEYQYLTRHFPGYRVNRQALKNHQGRFYDEMDIQLADGTSVVFRKSIAGALPDDTTLPKGLRPYGVPLHFVSGHGYPKSVGTLLPHTPSVCRK